MRKRSKKSGLIYLLHFEKKLHHAGHYLGFCEDDLEARLDRHRKGQGARLLEVVVAAGIDFSVARTWKGDRHFERKLKNQKNARRLCPICQKEHHEKSQETAHGTGEPSGIDTQVSPRRAA